MTHRQKAWDDFKRLNRLNHLKDIDLLIRETYFYRGFDAALNIVKVKLKELISTVPDKVERDKNASLP